MRKFAFSKFFAICQLSCVLFAANVVVECSEVMEVSVEKCAVDNSLVMLAGFSSISEELITPECQSVEDSEHLNFTLDFANCKMIAQVVHIIT